MVLIINQFKILIDNVKYKLFGEHLNVSDERFQTTVENCNTIWESRIFSLLFR